MKLKFLSATFLTLAFASAQAATFTVSTTADSGPGSLRQAISDANAASGDDVISFTTTGTVKLGSPLPVISDNVTISGPGSNLFTISGNNAVQIFTINAGITNVISGLTIANGLATGYANGAAIANAGTLTLLNCALLNNTNLGGWGGAIFNSGDLFITNSLLSQNHVAAENGSGMAADACGHAGGGGGSAGQGGGLFNIAGTVVLYGCILSGNSATAGDGGGTNNGTGRGGGFNGGQAGGDGANGNSGGFGGGGGGGGSCAGGNVPGGNGGAGGFGAGGGGPGGGAYGGGVGGQAGFGGGRGSTDVYQFGGAGGGGAGFGGGIFVENGMVTLVNCLFLGNQAQGGLGGIGPESAAANGSGFVGGVFTLNGTVALQNTAVNVLETNSPMETWTNGSLKYLAPIGTPRIFSNGQLSLGNIISQTPIQMSIQTSLTNGTIVYSLNGSDPRVQPIVYSDPFFVKTSTLVRAVAFNSNFSASVEMDPVEIMILPTLTTATYGGGTVSTAPTNGPYFSNSTAQITAIPASGYAFLQWLGDASGTNPTTTVTMNRNKFVQAVFGTTLATNVVGGGSLLVDPFLPLYPFGTAVKLTAQPQTGNYFVQWGASVSGTDNPASLVISNATPSVAAIFSALSRNEYALTMIESGHGSVMENPRANSYSKGQSVSLTAIPDAGQDFIAWTGDASGTQNPLLMTMNSNTVVTANFTARPALQVGTPLEVMDENGFRLTILGDFGVQYGILSSTNLFYWSPAGTVMNTYGTVQFTDPAATNFPYLFYRTVTN